MAAILQTGVYCIRNRRNGKRYVGSAAGSIRRRWNDHREYLRLGTHKSKHLQSSWNKYGEKAFAFEVLELCEPKKCIEREQHWIVFYKAANPNHGYNYCVAAGSWLGTNHHKETKDKIKRLWKRPGHRETVAKKNSIAATKQWADPVARLAMSNIKNRQYAERPELRKKISSRAKRQWVEYSDEERSESLRKMLDGNRKLRGTGRYNAVLTDQIVAEARKLREQGWTYPSLSERYGCGYLTIYKAVVGTTWSHV